MQHFSSLTDPVLMGSAMNPIRDVPVISATLSGDRQAGMLPPWSQGTARPPTPLPAFSPPHPLSPNSCLSGPRVPGCLNHGRYPWSGAMSEGESQAPGLHLGIQVQGGAWDTRPVSHTHPSGRRWD